jgi:branched-chain amino acid transport system substrate-binding protein
MAKELAAVSGPGGDRYTWEQLPEAINALEDGKDIDYEGVSGPINLNADGDPTAGVYDVFRYRDGKVEVFSEVPIEPPDRSASE